MAWHPMHPCRCISALWAMNFALLSAMAAARACPWLLNSFTASAWHLPQTPAETSPCEWIIASWLVP